MKKYSAFTLIELLIVVAIIAILAAIAVPNFMEAQVRSKISRVQSDIRSIATAIECYRVDNNSYPQACFVKAFARDSNRMALPNAVPYVNINYGPMLAIGNLTDSQKSTNSFSICPGMATITTPIAYISSYPTDPFAAKGMVYNYINALNLGWVLWSGGPDGDGMPQPTVAGTQIGSNQNNPGTFTQNGYGLNMAESGSVNCYWILNAVINGTTMNADTLVKIYNPTSKNPSAFLVTGGFTYDASNGTKSLGDIWRVKQ